MKCPKCHQNNPDDTHFCGQCGAPLTTPGSVTIPFSSTQKRSLQKHSLTIGSVFDKRYQVIEELGKGGMGTVYKVFDKKINESVALKLLKPEIAADETTIERFQNELKIARKITHKHVCRLYHISQEEDTPYIIMEYVQGEDLKTTIQKMGHFSLIRTVSIARQICEGLREAHKLGVVHRDLKPQNIMINQQGNAVVMDFGIARSLESEGITRTGLIIGTPHYMSPEQIEGQKIDQRADIYALGTILYEMSTGKLPFEGDTALGIGIKKKTEIPQDPRRINPQIPESFSRLILKCMDRDREKRYPNIETVMADLDQIPTGLPTTKKLETLHDKKETRISSPTIKPIWIAAITFFVFVVSAFFIFQPKFFRPDKKYENFVLIELLSKDSPEIERDVVEYLLQRALMSSTKMNVFMEDDYVIYKERTEASDRKIRNPLISVLCDVIPRVTGFEFSISVRHKNETSQKKFECRGPYDLISEKIDDILLFIAENSGGVIGEIEGGRSFSQICTANYDALKHFLKGEKAWKKLDSETAQPELKSAIENDGEFSLARLRYADVLTFRGYRDEASENIEKAWDHKDRLIEYDVLRLKSLQARIDDNISEERQYLGRLKEAFPLLKESHYEYAESYFHVGNPSEAIKHYLQALELDSSYAKAHNHLAFCYSWMGDHQKALDHFKQYVQLDNSSNSYDSLATGYMFAGEYEAALETLEKGIDLDSVEDYLFGNMSRNYVLMGILGKAEKNLREQTLRAKREITQFNILFNQAYIDYTRENWSKASEILQPVREFYSKEAYQLRVDESPTLPFWLTGILAAHQENTGLLEEMIRVLEKKISDKQINGTHYYPIYKFYLHLKILEGSIKGDINLVMSMIEEGKRIKEKMGFWSSMFNLPYFFNEYANVLMAFDRIDEALQLLNEAVAYNPNHAAAQVSLAKLYLKNNEKELAKKECSAARILLSKADSDFCLLRELQSIESVLDNRK